MWFYVKVKPNSKEQKIEKINENHFIINLRERAENNKANIELLKLMKKEFRKNFRIKSGLTSKNKILEEA